MSSAESSEELPFYLRGNYAPVGAELSASDLPVKGSIPRELEGLYLRNGPNPREGAPPHWFVGQGMIHGVRLEAGRAAWYRNRWVRSEEPLAPANTHVVGHAGRIFALVETALPTLITPELETVGPYDFDGRLHTAMTAHPKTCPTTGELHFFGYGFAPPYLSYHRADASGRLVQSEEIQVPAAAMFHDFAITGSRVLFMDLPVVFRPEELEKGRFPFVWSEEHGARLGIMPRGGGAADMRWFEIEPCYVFHPLNAFDDGERVVLDAVRYPELWREGANRFDQAFLHRWIVDPVAEKVIEQPLDDRPVEFPRADERLTGLRHRYGYAVCGASVDESPPALLKYDLERGGSQRHDFGDGRAPGEAVFVPAAEAAGEDEGWLLCFVYDATRDGSDLVILDASHFAGPPQAVIQLPQRVPFGFHGSWIPRPW